MRVAVDKTGENSFVPGIDDNFLEFCFEIGFRFSEISAFTGETDFSLFISCTSTFIAPGFPSLILVITSKPVSIRPILGLWFLMSLLLVRIVSLCQAVEQLDHAVPPPYAVGLQLVVVHAFASVDPLHVPPDLPRYPVHAVLAFHVDDYEGEGTELAVRFQPVALVFGDDFLLNLVLYVLKPGTMGFGRAQIPGKGN